MDNKSITFGGKTMNINEWSERIGVNSDVIRQRIGNGKSVEEVLAPKEPDGVVVEVVTEVPADDYDGNGSND